MYRSFRRMRSMERAALPALIGAVWQAICSLLHAATGEACADALLQQGIGALKDAHVVQHSPSAAWAWLAAYLPAPTPAVAAQMLSHDICAAVLTALQGMEELLEGDECRAQLLGCVLHCLPAVAGVDGSLDQRVAQLARVCVAAVHDDAAPHTQAAVAARAYALTDERVLEALYGGSVASAQGRCVHKHLELLVKVIDLLMDCVFGCRTGVHCGDCLWCMKAGIAADSVQNRGCSCNGLHKNCSKSMHTCAGVAGREGGGGCQL